MDRRAQLTMQTISLVVKTSLMCNLWRQCLQFQLKSTGSKKEGVLLVSKRNIPHPHPEVKAPLSNFDEALQVTTETRSTWESLIAIVVTIVGNASYRKASVFYKKTLAS